MPVGTVTHSHEFPELAYDRTGLRHLSLGVGIQEILRGARSGSQLRALDEEQPGQTEKSFASELALFDFCQALRVS